MGGSPDVMYWLRVIKAQRLALFACLVGIGSGGNDDAWSVQGAFISSNVGPGAFGRMSAGPTDGKPKSELNTISGGPATWSNPTGRVSVQFGPGAVRLLSTSIILPGVPQPATCMLMPDSKKDLLHTHNFNPHLLHAALLDRPRHRFHSGACMLVLSLVFRFS